MNFMGIGVALRAIWGFLSMPLRGGAKSQKDQLIEILTSQAQYDASSACLAHCPGIRDSSNTYPARFTMWASFANYLRANDATGPGTFNGGSAGWNCRGSISDTLYAEVCCGNLE